MATQSYDVLRTTSEVCQKEMNSRKNKAIELMLNWLDENEEKLSTDFSVCHVSDACMDCQLHINEHYPTVHFALYHLHAEMHAELVINKDKTIANIIIEDARSMSRLYSIKKHLKGEIWESIPILIDKEISNFLDDIEPLIDIYIEALDRPHHHH